MSAATLLERPAAEAEPTQWRLSRYLAASAPVGAQAVRMLYATRTTRSVLVRDDDWQLLQQGRLDALPAELLSTLQAAKVLVPVAEDERAAVVNHNKTRIAEDRSLYLGISPSANCQLGCDYCGQEHENHRMDEALMQGVLNKALHKLAERPGYRHMQIGWFGGEPLLGIAVIRALSPRLQALAREHQLSYRAQMATNGLALTPKLFFELVQQHAVKAFDITLDGAREYHDQRRVTKEGKPSFDRIFNNLRGIAADPRFAGSGVALSIRCNVDGRNHEGTRALLEQLQQADLLRHFHFYTAPVHSWGNDAHLASLGQQQYAAFELELLGRLIDTGRAPSLLPQALKPVVCMSVKQEAELVDSYGQSYNCTEISQVPAYKEVRFYRLGKVQPSAAAAATAPAPAPRPFADWNDRILAGEVPCHNCRILPICGGKCPKLWTEGISPCPPIKHNLEERLLLEMVRLQRRGQLVQGSRSA